MPARGAPDERSSGRESQPFRRLSRNWIFFSESTLSIRVTTSHQAAGYTKSNPLGVGRLRVVLSAKKKSTDGGRVATCWRMRTAKLTTEQANADMQRCHRGLAYRTVLDVAN